MSEFKLIVAGGRDFNDYQLLSTTVFAYAEAIVNFDYLAIVSGMARGADRLAYQFARKEGATVYEFPANWDEYGKRAGYVRNEEMAHFSDGLLAFWDGKSRGTANMIETMNRLNKRVNIVQY